MAKETNLHCINVHFREKICYEDCKGMTEACPYEYICL